MNGRIEVCSSCRRASCWQGRFNCGDSRGAGVVLMSVEDLAGLALESSDYWSVSKR